MRRASPSPPSPLSSRKAVRTGAARCRAPAAAPSLEEVCTNLPSSPHTSSHMFGHHPATVRLAWRKRHARFESSEALAEQPAVARTAVELHGCCAGVSLAEVLLRQHTDGVARASSAGTESGSSTRSLVSCSPCWRPSRDAYGAGTRYSSTTNRTRKSLTATPRAAQLAVA